MTGNQTAIAFIDELAWEQLPEPVRHQAKRCLLDALGALIAGTQTPVGRLMADIAVSQFGGDQATVLSSGARASAAGAALANGFAQNALDIDDGYRLVKGHPGACVLPVILAAAQMTSCTGKQFLAALVTGYEIGIRAGLIRHATSPTYHSSGSWGAIAGAAAAAKLMGLDRPKLYHALGTAEYHAPIAPMMKCIQVPSMGKDSIGWGCFAGMLSALMAKDGFSGINPLFDETPKTEWIEGLGRDFQILNLYFKPYAACRWAQPAVAGALKLSAAHQLAAKDIRSIRIRTFHAAAALSCKPPQNTEEAQYNMAFPVAAALIDGEVGPRQVLAPRLFAADLLALAALVKTEVDEAFEAEFPAKACAEVLIETIGAKAFSSGRMEARWEPPDSLPTDAELETKFRWLVTPVLSKTAVDALTALIWRFDATQNAVTQLIAACL
jgi:2-methylcitrate dehydratase PrpD